MAGKEQENRIFVGGLSWDVTERQLEDVFSRFGKIIDSENALNGFMRNFWSGASGGSNQEFESVVGSLSRGLLHPSCVLNATDHVMLERDTGRPRGFGFLTFADRRGMEDAIREMHGREFGDRVISVNRAQPKMGEDPGHGYGGGYSSSGRSNYGVGGDKPAGQDNCFKCGRLGHWARDCPSAGGGRGTRPISPRSRFGAAGGSGDRYGGDRDRYMDDRYDGGRYGDRDRYDSRGIKYGSRDRFVSDRYPSGGDRFVGDRYGGPDHFPQNGYGRDRGYDRDGGPKGSGDRYGAGGPARYGGRNYQDRPAPYERPPPRRGGRPSSYDRY